MKVDVCSDNLGDDLMNTFDNTVAVGVRAEVGRDTIPAFNDNI